MHRHHAGHEATHRCYAVASYVWTSFNLVSTNQSLRYTAPSNPVDPIQPHTAIITRVLSTRSDRVRLRCRVRQQRSAGGGVRDGAGGARSDLDFCA